MRNQFIVTILFLSVLAFVCCGGGQVSTTDNDEGEDEAEKNRKANTTEETDKPVGFAESPGVEPDFRNVRWGMTMEEVEAAETAELLKDLSGEFGEKGKTRLAYRCRLLDKYYSFLAYIFDSNKLIAALYQVSETDEDLYSEITDILTIKYGEPAYDGYQSSGWESIRTFVYVTKERESYKTGKYTISIMYTDAVYRRASILKEEKEKEKFLKDF